MNETPSTVLNLVPIPMDGVNNELNEEIKYGMLTSMHEKFYTNAVLFLSTYLILIKMVGAVLLSLLANAAFAQYIDSSTVDIKVGLGPSYLKTGTILIGKAEIELTKKWNTYISQAVSVSGGYGDVQFYDKYASASQTAFTTHVDANIFLSPFGNNRYDNFKLGTGFSVMYISEKYPFQNIYLPPPNRVSLGYNLIIENEVAVSRKYLIGVKAIMQSYLNKDIATSVFLKAGRKF